MNEGGLTGLNVRCVEVLTFFGAKDASRNCQWWQIIETRIETFPKLWQEAVNGQKHMDAASAASKAREAYHLQSSNWHRGNLKRSVCRVQIGLNIFEQSSIFEEAVTLPYPSQRWTWVPWKSALVRSEVLQVITSNKHLSKLVPCVRQHLAAIAAPGAKRDGTAIDQKHLQDCSLSVVIWCLYSILYISILSKSVKSFIEGSLEVKLPTIWTDEKQRWEESEKRREEKRKSHKKEDPGARKGRKVPKHCCGFGGSKSRLAKAAGAEPAGQMRDEKLHAVVARSTFPSQNVQSTPCSDHFWKLRCRKIARRCGAKHISKSKCTKHTMLGPLLEVEMSKKCTPLWREAHVEVKMHKAHHARTTFGSWDVEKVHAVVARSTCRSQNAQSTEARSTFGRSGVVLRGRRKGLCTLSKVSKTWGFCGNFKKRR